MTQIGDNLQLLASLPLNAHLEASPPLSLPPPCALQSPYSVVSVAAALVLAFDLAAAAAAPPAALPVCRPQLPHPSKKRAVACVKVCQGWMSLSRHPYCPYDHQECPGCLPGQACSCRQPGSNGERAL